jgi:DNA-binding NtrC family response regulator
MAQLLHYNIHAKGGNGTMIVIIDDDRAFLRSIELLLRDSGDCVKTFSCAIQAISFIEECRSIDLLIVDYSLPFLRGDEVINVVREILPESCRIILISGHAGLINPENFSSGDITFMAKPLDFNLLSDYINEKQIQAVNNHYTSKEKILQS